MVAVGAQFGDLCAKANLTAQRNDPAADILHNRQQYVSTHMGLGIVEDILPGSGLHELLQNPADSGVVDSGIELAVGEGTGAALAELDVAHGI